MNKKDRDLIGSQMREILSDELSKPADKIAAAKMLQRLGLDDCGSVMHPDDRSGFDPTLNSRPIDLE